MVAAVKRAIAENSELHTQVETYFNEKVTSLAKELIEKADVNANGVKVVKLRGTFPADLVKSTAFAVRAASPENTAFVAATSEVTGKPLLTVMLTDDVAATGMSAAAIVREAAKNIKGGGGGQPGFAQAGGKNVDGLATAFTEMVEKINS